MIDWSVVRSTDWLFDWLICQWIDWLIWRRWEVHIRPLINFVKSVTAEHNSDSKLNLVFNFQKKVRNLEDECGVRGDAESICLTFSLPLSPSTNQPINQSVDQGYERCWRYSRLENLILFSLPFWLEIYVLVNFVLLFCLSRKYYLVFQAVTREWLKIPWTICWGISTLLRAWQRTGRPIILPHLGTGWAVLRASAAPDTTPVAMMQAFPSISLLILVRHLAFFDSLSSFFNPWLFDL